MKISLKECIRGRTIIILLVLLVISLVMTLWRFLQPLKVAKDVPVYQYTQQAQVNYLVHFQANNFFDELTAGPGRGYITSLTDYIETQLVYRLNGDSPAVIQGNMEVIAKLTGYILHDNKNSDAGEKQKVIIWEKTIPLLAPTSYSSNDTRTEIKKVIPINLKQFKDFAGQVNTAFYNPADAVDLTVLYNITSTVSNNQGTSTSQVCPLLVIPIQGNTFAINGVLNDKKDNAINVKKMVLVPGARGARQMSVGVTIFLTLLLLAVIFGTTIEEEDPFERELRRIMKKHGDRIVAARGSIPRLFEGNQLSLESLEELIKVADELGQPILYESIQARVHSFYVINEPLIYKYSLEITIESNQYLNDYIS